MTSSINFDIFARDNASATFDRLGRKVNDTSSIFERHKGTIIAAASAAGAAIVAFGKQSIDAYLDADKSQRVLEDAYRRFPAVADVPIQAMRDLSAELQLKTGYDDDETAAMMGKLAAYKLTGKQIMELTPLVQDYAAKTGKDILTASDDMGKALMGQGRALKLIGIDFKDTGSTAGNFTELMGGLRTQVGGFAEQEGKTAEGRMKILQARFGDLQEAVGEKLLPVMEKATDVFSLLLDIVGPIVSAVGSIPAPVLAAVAALTAFHLLRGPIGTMGSAVGGVMSSLGQAFGYAGQSAERAGGGLKGFAAGVRTFTGGGVLSGLRSGLGGIVGLLGGPWGIAFMAASTVLGGWIKKQQDAEAAAAAFSGTLDEQTGAVTEATRKLAVDQLLKEFSAADWQQVARDTGLGIGQVVNAMMVGGDALKSVQDRIAAMQAAAQQGVDFGASTGKLQALGQAVGLVDAQLTDGRAKTQVYGEVLGQAGDAASGATNPITGMGNAADNAGSDMQDAADAATNLAQAALDVTDAAMGADRAQIAFKDSLAQAKEALKDNGKTLNTNTDAGRKNRGALLDLADAAAKNTQATYRTTGSVDAAQRTMRSAREDFIKMATQMNGGNRRAAELLADKYGLTRQSVNNLSGAMKDVPKKITSSVTVNTAQAWTAVQNVKSWLAGIRNKTVYITAITAAAQGTNVRSTLNDIYGSRAQGGAVRAGEIYAVGDNPDGSWNRTTELFMPDSAGQVVNAADSRKMLAAAGVRASTGNAPAKTDTETFVGVVQLVIGGKVIQEELLRLKRTSGGMSLGLA